MPKRGHFDMVIDTDDTTVPESVAAIARLISPNSEGEIESGPGARL
jgi:hypothetical protein